MQRVISNTDAALASAVAQGAAIAANLQRDAKEANSGTRYGVLGDAQLHEQPHARKALPKGTQHELSGMAIATAAARSADTAG